MKRNYYWLTGGLCLIRNDLKMHENIACKLAFHCVIMQYFSVQPQWLGDLWITYDTSPVPLPRPKNQKLIVDCSRKKQFLSFSTTDLPLWRDAPFSSSRPPNSRNFVSTRSWPQKALKIPLSMAKKEETSPRIFDKKRFWALFQGQTRSYHNLSFIYFTRERTSDFNITWTDCV